MKQEILSKLLSKGLQLWLRSQVSHVSTLDLTIHGTNQQLLSGQIPQVDLTATQAIYQGLHLSHVDLTGKNIKINLRQILQGKPIQLLEPIPLTGVLTLTAPDLQASLMAPLLASALEELLQTLLVSRRDLQHDLQIPRQIHWQQADISADGLKLVGRYPISMPNSSPPLVDHLPINQDSAPKMESVTLQTGLTIAQPHQLCLTPLVINFSHGRGAIDLESFLLDLGQDVVIQELVVAEGQLICQGQLTVQP